MSLSNDSLSRVPQVPKRTSYDHHTSRQQSFLEDLTGKSHTHPRLATYHRRYALVKKRKKVDQGLNTGLHPIISGPSQHPWKAMIVNRQSGGYFQKVLKKIGLGKEDMVST